MASSSDSQPGLAGNISGNANGNETSLAASFGSRVNIVATSPDSPDGNLFQVRDKGIDKTVTAWYRHRAMLDLFGIEKAIQNMHDIIYGKADKLVLSNFDTSVVAPPRYSNRQKILLVGEGDFSFSSCLATAFISASHITATSLDSRETVVRKYCKGEGHLRNLTSRGAVVIHQVDAGTMYGHPRLRGKIFDRIIFNFPHAGGSYPGFSEIDRRCIEMHRGVVRVFFAAAKKMLAEKGEVHVALKRGFPYEMWNIVELAENAGLMLVREGAFPLWYYPGYENKKGYGADWNKTFPAQDASVFIFCCKT